MFKKLFFLFIFLYFTSFQAQEDCVSAISLCGNSAINYTPSGIGNVNENLGGCLATGEHNSVWYKFTIATSGTLTFDLTPTQPIDYDWSIYGPNITCGNLGTPIRCNASGYYVPTGMNMTNTNTTSGGGNTDPYCQYMDVLAGETYYLYLDNWDSTVYTFNLIWGGTATFVSAFNDPSLTPFPFITPGNPNINPNNPNGISICANSTIFDFNSLSSGIINGNQNFQVHYFLNASDATTGTNPISTPISVNTTDTYYYSINYQDPINPNNPANYCKQSGSFIFINETIPSIITSSSTILCPNGTVTLTSNNSTGNLWSTGQTSQSISVSNSGTYTLSNTNGICANPTTSVAITNSQNPNLQISGNLTFCEGSSTILTATANGTGNIYSWSNGTNGATNTVTNGGLQTVTVTTSAGCTYQKSVTVIKDPAIVINIATPAQLNCNTTQVTLNATGSIFQAGSAISWSASAGGNIVSGANTLSPIVNSAGNYTCTITSNLANGCSNQASINVINNNNPPIITLTATKITICKGENVVLTATGAQTYTWTGLTGNGNTQIVSPTIATTYTVTGIGANGCTAVNPATISINVVPKITSTLSDGEFCIGTPVILDAGIGANYSYLWNTGETSQTISVTNPGNYSVTINNGICSQVFSANISFKPVPEIQNVTYSNSTLVIIAANSTNQILEYSIDDGTTWQDSNVFQNIKNNIGLDIFVRIKGENCFSSINYYSFVMQNIITPNDDGYNDVIDFSNIIDFKNVTIAIFDRYGTSVFKATKQKPIWDGTYNSRKLQTASYWYIIKWTDSYKNKPIELTGWILLKNRD